MKKRVYFFTITAKPHSMHKTIKAFCFNLQFFKFDNDTIQITALSSRVSGIQNDHISDGAEEVQDNIVNSFDDFWVLGRLNVFAMAKIRNGFLNGIV